MFSMSHPRGTNRMRLWPIIIVVLLARLAGAQATDTTSRVATVSGVVHDSLARRTLAGAIVQLVGSDGNAQVGRSAVSDSVGRFSIGGVPAGRYALGFFHPILDSLGVEAPLREVYVEDARPVRVDLATPSPVRLRTAICGRGASGDVGAVIVGIVRDARSGAPVANVTVTGQWFELSFRTEGLVREMPRLAATTGANGWFALCNVPRGGTISLVAGRGADSTDHLEVEIPAEGFMRRELFLAPSRVATADTSPADAASRSPRRRLTGDGRLTGTVVTAVGSIPLAGATVGIVDGPQTRTDEQGSWALSQAPLGTRMLEVRAIGYYPVRRAVDVVAGAAPIRTALSTMKAVLDTVKVVASRLTDVNMKGFAERRKTTGGRFFTPDDIARRQPIVTTDMFRIVPGVRFDGPHLMMRDIMDEDCIPAVYVDAHYMRDLTIDEIDGFVQPSEIAGIEVYLPGRPAPAQFQPTLGGCGSIVIWTKLRTSSRRR